jgi:hypothetical protein
MGKTIEEVLINKKVKVVPIKRENGLFPKGHDGEFMYSDTVWSTCLPIDASTNSLVQIFDDEERKLLEQKLHLKEGDLSFYNKNSPYWGRFRVALTREGKVLDLSNPIDYISYKVLLANKRTIAPDWDSRNKSGEYKFALMDEEEQVKTEATKAEVNKNAWKYYGKIEDNVVEMQNVLRLYGRKTNSNKLEFLRSEISKIIETTPKEFLNIMEDPKYKIKVFIENCLSARIIEKTSVGGFALIGGDEIGRTLTETISFLESPRNQDIYLKLKAQLENSK